MSTVTADLDHCVANLDTLSKSVKNAGDTLHILAGCTSQTANECLHSSNGLGRQIKDLCTQWQSISSDANFSDKNASTSFFTQTVEEAKERFTKIESTVESAMERVGDTVASVESRISAFEEIRSALVPHLPALLSNHLSETIRDYKPTGDTPTRKYLPFPKTVPRTERHSVLLTQFRQDHGRLPLEDVSNDPNAERRKGDGSSIFFMSDEENAVLSCGSRTSSGVVSNAIFFRKDNFKSINPFPNYERKVDVVVQSYKFACF